MWFFQDYIVLHPWNRSFWIVFALQRGCVATNKANELAYVSLASNILRQTQTKGDPQTCRFHHDSHWSTAHRCVRSCSGWQVIIVVSHLYLQTLFASPCHYIQRRRLFNWLVVMNICCLFVVFAMYTSICIIYAFVSKRFHLDVRSYLPLFVPSDDVARLGSLGPSDRAKATSESPPEVHKVKLPETQNTMYFDEESRWAREWAVWSKEKTSQKEKERWMGL